MRHLSLILALFFLGGLLIASQAFATGQPPQINSQTTAALSGEKLQQWHLAQVHPQTEDQIQPQQLTREQAIEMKRLLNQRGYRISNSDGIIGNETMAAIYNFQEEKGLTLTGTPNQETLRALVLSTPQHEFFGLSPEFGEDDE